MYLRGSVFDLEMHPTQERPLANIVAHDRPVAIVSNNDHNLSTRASTVTVIPRATMGRSISPETVPGSTRPDWVFSPAGECRCNRHAIFDCKFILRGDKISHPSQLAARSIESVGTLTGSPRGELPPERIQQIGNGITATLTRVKHRRGVIPLIKLPSDERFRVRRAWLLQLRADGKEPDLSVLLSSDEIRFRTVPQFAVVCPVIEWPDHLLEPKGRVVVSAQIGAELRRYVVLERNVRTSDLRKEKLEPVLIDGKRVVVFGDEQMLRIEGVVLRYLGVNHQ